MTQFPNWMKPRREKSQPITGTGINPLNNWKPFALCKYNFLVAQEWGNFTEHPNSISAMNPDDTKEVVPLLETPHRIHAVMTIPVLVEYLEPVIVEQGLAKLYQTLKAEANRRVKEKATDSEGAMWFLDCLGIKPNQQVRLSPLFPYRVLQPFLSLESNIPVADVDIVCIHGLGGHADMTWTSDESVVWPEKFLKEDLRAEFPSTSFRLLSIAHDITLFSSDYPATLESVTNDVAEAAPWAGLGRKPILWLCHSLGGIVVKSILLRYPEFTLRTLGVVFYGCPHMGSPLAKEFGRQTAFGQKIVPDSLALRLLRREETGELLDTLCSTFQDYRIPFLNLVEQKKTFVAVRNDVFEHGALVVDGESAMSQALPSDNPDLAIDDRGRQTVRSFSCQRVQKDHTDICKLSNRDDLVYLYTRDHSFAFLRQFLMSGSLHPLPALSMPDYSNSMDKTTLHCFNRLCECLSWLSLIQHNEDLDSRLMVAAQTCCGMIEGARAIVNWMSSTSVDMGLSVIFKVSTVSELSGLAQLTAQTTMLVSVVTPLMLAFVALAGATKGIDLVDRIKLAAVQFAHADCARELYFTPDVERARAEKNAMFYKETTDNCVGTMLAYTLAARGFLLGCPSRAEVLQNYHVPICFCKRMLRLVTPKMSANEVARLANQTAIEICSLVK